MKMLLKLVFSATLIYCAYGQCDTNQACVVKKFCAPDGKVIEDGTSLIISRLNTECPQGTKCCIIPEDAIKPVVMPLHQRDDILDISCGLRGDQNPFRNQTGPRLMSPTNKQNQADVAEFPWVILISRKSGDDNDFHGRFSTGSLIHVKVVLTAAHTLRGETADNLKVIAGDYNIGANDEISATQERDVERIVKFDDFSADNFKNDVALLFVIKPFELDYHIDLICLPPNDAVFTGDDCVVSGWGKDRYGGEDQKILKKIDLKVVDSKECEMKLKATGKMNPIWEIHDSFMCAGGQKDKDSCTGDGGAALICPVVGGKTMQYYQAGIVAWGISCGLENVPGLYANVVHLRDWIDSKLPTA